MGLRRSAFLSAGPQQGGPAGIAVLGDPICGLSAGGTMKLWHGFLGPTGLPTVSVPRTGSASTFALWPPAPNPSAERCEFRFSVPPGVRASLAIFDADGRLVRRLSVARVAGGPSGRWMLDREDGGPVAPGIYFVRLEGNGRRAVRRIAVIR